MGVVDMLWHTFQVSQWGTNHAFELMPMDHEPLDTFLASMFGLAKEAARLVGV
jgi:hypothetical protein